MKCFCLVLLACATTAVAFAAPAHARAAGERIAPLTVPAPAVPPRLDGEEPGETDQQLEESLKRKRRERLEREADEAPPAATFAQRRTAALLKDALTPRPQALLMELALAVCGVATRGDRQGYTCDPTVHFNVFLRYHPSRPPDRTGLWYGLRVAPFVGTGFYKNRPGAYGSTYFGPMVGVGKIDRQPVDDGTARAASATGEPEIPSGSGWLVGAGIAWASQIGHGGPEIADDDKDDFRTKKTTFDAPGSWLEARYLHVLYGALALDGLAGFQAGRGKTFYYVGLGVGGWY